MNPRELALEFVRCFCANDLDGLEALLSQEFRFCGPLFEFDSRAAYLASLRDAPPDPASFTVISISEEAGQVALFYDYERPDLVLRMAQLFTIVDGEITDILLVFDPSPFR